MNDPHGRSINYLRISVTDRCNLRCRYCMPEGCAHSLPQENILSFEEIRSIAAVCVKNGIGKIRLTGGEPLTRGKITDLVGMLAEIGGIKDLSMTTNGILLKKLAKPLKSAGLNRINISMDTIDPEKYKWITRGGDLQDVLDGIDAAEEAGLLPIKINCVVKGSSEDEDAVPVRAFCASRGFRVRFIREMNLENGEYAVVEGGTGGDCRICNKIRLSCDGNFRPCLFSDLAFNTRTLGAEEAFRMAIEAKPPCGTRSYLNKFNFVGG
ncbi:MAG: radical SAM protein [Deltaproteobacteria bacterium]|nr:radical SAM protein [Deltaproteobacteria bacterium]